ncbi:MULTISPECIES: tripartite tricarboxylate transporter TctB family protein [Roseobacteraceae]|uniref:Tripartite tricarboxylate transporter TctB family protein n=1 Tax=Pseudosulfitobacter pseudonitzschiae TaxID=1402135 RepID=A0A221K7N0_9RHOB|nr:MULTISPECIES: tripartite tricarboxylate transporter TctB family protein [Roseobacteraceae]ASM74857.1 tripartite tricarboxylate transporter TctB family protein [Pseudosulfitobacter pseudonitzschiae]
MTLDRWIALAFITLCCIYGYAAFFTMDDQLPPILRRNPVWPSTFPKILTVLGLIAGFVILFGSKRAAGDAKKDGAIDLTRLGNYHVGQALALIALMVAYAFTLRPFGFVGATISFLLIGSLVLGERRFHIMIPVAAIAAVSIWYLVQEVLGIFLRPWPAMFM